MGKRSRKRSAQPAKPRPPRPKLEYRTAERNEAARAALVPLAEGERPRAVTAAALFALVLAVVQIVIVLTGHDLSGNSGQVVGAGLFVAILLVAAWGCWRVKYWAVLGMQALLALIILYFFLASTRASSAVDWLIVVGAIVPSGVLFWFLVKAMARIQMPDRSPS